MSMAITGAVARARRVAVMTARQSEPTKPAIGGGKCTPPSGAMAKPSSTARRVTGAASAGAKGAPPNPTGETPRARWCMAVLPTTVMS